MTDFTPDGTPKNGSGPLPDDAAGLAHIRLVVTDLDGTLLATDKSISPQNRAAIERLRAQGIAFTIASGRMSQILASYVHELGITVPVIACNGAKIFDPVQDKVLDHCFLDAVAAESLLDFSARHGLDYLAFGMADVHYAPDSRRVQHYRNYNEIAVRTGVPPVPLIPFGNDPAGEHRALARAGLLKILVAERRGGDIPLALQHIAGFASIYPEVSEPNIIDVLPIAANKGRALERIARELGIALSDVCVFGDYENDISMMQVAGHSFAMANAVESVRRTATYLTDSNDEHGFATAIDRYILKKKETSQ